MTVRTLTGTTVVVTGAGRGFGRATTHELAARGATVVGVGRSDAALAGPARELGRSFVAEVGDVRDPGLADRLVARHRPRAIVLNAGAVPPVGSLLEQTWEGFGANWDADVAQAFHFARAALRAPLEPGSVVVMLSSGAALNGSPLSGGYAGAKATVRFVSAYAAGESERAGAGIRFVAVLPQLTPATELGRTYTRAYAERAGISEEQLVAGFGGELTAELAAAGIADLVVDDLHAEPAYLLGPRGLRPAD